MANENTEKSHISDTDRYIINAFAWGLVAGISSMMAGMDVSRGNFPWSAIGLITLCATSLHGLPYVLDKIFAKRASSEQQ